MTNERHGRPVCQEGIPPEGDGVEYLKHAVDDRAKLLAGELVEGQPLDEKPVFLEL
jgi:hypothetical protein